ncbi:hypothetical protein BJX66DRAFT_54079 [Aspergillus keveii]|uniref:Uncharacterized protein n=1 Tax=Aspergillus keveii TaxID=714993 RepID=A0ABR4GGR0_9EURO
MVRPYSRVLWSVSRFSCSLVARFLHPGSSFDSSFRILVAFLLTFPPSPPSASQFQPHIRSLSDAKIPPSTTAQSTHSLCSFSRPASRSPSDQQLLSPYSAHPERAKSIGNPPSRPRLYHARSHTQI